MIEDVQRTVDSLLQLWNTGSAEVADRLYSKNSQRYDPNQPAPGQGPAGIAQYVAEVRQAFPDFKLDIKERIVEGDRLVTHWTCTGTHQAEFTGIPATGKPVAIDGLTLARIQNGKIVEERVYFDRLTLLEQLGVTPALQSETLHAAR